MKNLCARRKSDGFVARSRLTGVMLSVPLLVLTPMLVLAVETDRITVEDLSTGAIKFKVTSDGNVTGASFTGTPIDGAAISIQQGGVEANTVVKLRVKDSAGIDKFTVSPNGAMTVTSEAASPTINLTSSTNTVGQASTFVGRKSRGTPTAPTAVQAGDNLFTLSGLGYNGTGWHTASAALFMPAREAFTPTAKGTDVAFLTTAPGGTARTEKFRITGEGNVGIGTSVPAQKLEVNGGVRMNTTTAIPACDSTARGTLWYAQGGTGVKDAVSVCTKDAGDAYAWRILW